MPEDHKVLSYVADLKSAADSCRGGLGKVPLAGQAQVRLLGAKRIEETYDLLADARQVLDVNPLFADGVHDRVTSAMINGCLCCSDMSVTADPAMGTADISVITVTGIWIRWVMP